MTNTRVYLDSNALITAFEGDGTAATSARQLLSLLQAGRYLAVTSELTLSEVLVLPLRLGDRALADRYHQALRPSGPIQVLPVTRPLLMDAAGMRAIRPGLKLPDAVHIATAAAADCTLLVSADRTLRPADGMTRLDFDDAFALLNGRPEPT